MSAATPALDKWEMVLDRMEQVDLWAQRFARRWPQRTYDEFRSAGIEVVERAAAKYQTSKGVRFQSYVEPRIRYGMTDYLRKEKILNNHRSRGALEVELTEARATKAGDEVDYSDAIALQQLRPRLLCAISTLKPRERELIRLYFFEGLSHREIGLLQHRHMTASSLRLTRILAKLRAAMAQ